MDHIWGNLRSPSNPVRQDLTSPLLVNTRYYYPLVMGIFYIFALAFWGIATSGSSKPKPPPVKGIYTNGHPARKQQCPTRSRICFNKLAARFPGGLPQNKEDDEMRLGPLRKAIMNWLLIAVLCTLMANTINVIMRTLITPKHDWWCGKDYVV